MDYYLKFADEAEAQSVLYTDDTPDYQNIDTIGTIYKPTGEVDAEGNPVMAPVPGWHVNIRCGEAPELDVFMVEPKFPVRVWA